MDDADYAEDVGVEHGSHHVGGDVREIDGTVALDIDAGIVDQDVETAVGLQGFRRGRDGGIVGDIQLDRSRTELGCGEAAAFRVTAADMDGVPGGHEAAGGLETGPCSRR